MSGISKKVYQKAQKKGLSPFEVGRINHELELTHAKSMEEAAIVMAAIYTNVLVEEFWPKTAAKNLPKLNREVWYLYDSYLKGHVSLENVAAYNKQVGQCEIRGKSLKLDGSGKWERFAEIRSRRENAMELLAAAANELEKDDTAQAAGLVKRIRNFLEE